LARLLPGLDAIYANSEYTLGLARKFLPEGLDIQLHEFDVPELPLYAKRKRIGYFGYFNQTKGVHVLLQAMAQVTGAQLLMFCDVPEELRDGRRIYGHDNVLVMGAYSRSDLPVLLNLVDVVVVPSINESYGLVKREVEMLGMRCLATSTGGLAGTIEPNNAEALAKAIQEVVDGD
jgi:glycosyltransferase involved in cell wall biosynthesis